MKGRGGGASAISKYSYSKLKGHLMRFAQKDPATAMAEENIGENAGMDPSAAGPPCCTYAIRVLYAQEAQPLPSLAELAARTRYA